MQRIGELLDTSFFEKNTLHASAAESVLAARLKLPVENIRQTLVRRASKTADPKNSPYHTFPKEKKLGGIRWITAPHDDLKRVQRAIADCVLAPRYRPLPIVHGFVHGRDIKTNAQAHLHGHADTDSPRYALNIDLEKAFPSVKGPRVLAIFSELTDPILAKFLGYLATWQDEIPQGAPTSPLLLNFACRELDYALMQIADRHGLTLSRYVDDITLSSDAAIPPALLDEVRMTAQHSGFRLNEKKTRWHDTRKNAIEITGLKLVGGAVCLPREARRFMRGALHATACLPDPQFTKHHVGYAVGMTGFAVHIHGDLPRELIGPYSLLRRQDRVPPLRKLDQRKWRDTRNEFALWYARGVS